MRTNASLLLLLVVLASSPALAQQPAEAQITASMQSLVTAQETFDVARMEQVLAADYIEISPVGEVESKGQGAGLLRTGQEAGGWYSPASDAR